MDALRVEEAKATVAGITHLRPVSGSAESAYAPSVRPDRPNSRSSRTLYAVDTPASADSSISAVQWARRAPQQAVITKQSSPLSVSQAKSIAHADTRIDDLLFAAMSIIGVLLAFSLGMFLYVALGFGIEAGQAMTVMSGDSLWGIAASLDTDIPTSQIVQDIVELNDLNSTTIVAGTELILPAY